MPEPRESEVPGFWATKGLRVFGSSGRCKLQSQREIRMSPKFSSPRFQILVHVSHMTTTQQSNLRFDQLLRSVLLLLRYWERSWTHRPQTSASRICCIIGVESMEGERGEKERSWTAPSQLVPGNRAAHSHQGFAAPIFGYSSHSRYGIVHLGCKPSSPQTSKLLISQNKAIIPQYYTPWKDSPSSLLFSILETCPNWFFL